MSPAQMDDGHRILCTLDEVLQRREMTLTELADRVGITIANISVLKNNHAKAIRFSTLTAICDVLDCDVSDLLRVDNS